MTEGSLSPDDHRSHDRAGGDVSSEPEIHREAERILDEGAHQGLAVRLIGGLAIYRSCPRSRTIAGLSRTYPDIDVVVPGGATRPTTTLFAALGYEPDRRFNALHGATRLLFRDLGRERQVDVFVGVFSMCHRIDLTDRLLPGYTTLPLADLLVTKLQIVQLNEKDVKDALCLLLDNAPNQGERFDAIDLGRLVALSSDDWGLFTTLVDNLETVARQASAYLEEADASAVRGRARAIIDALSAAPKSRRWRIRSMVGRRVAWYELPDEVAQ
jgi:hypothetical protein